MNKVLLVYEAGLISQGMNYLAMDLEQGMEYDPVICTSRPDLEDQHLVMAHYGLEANYMLDEDPSTSAGVQLARHLEAFDRILREEEAQVVVVYGSSLVALAAAQMSAERGVPLIHVDAGVRASRSRVGISQLNTADYRQFVIDLLADYHCVGTIESYRQLLYDHHSQVSLKITGYLNLETIPDLYLADDWYGHPVLDWVGTDRWILLIPTHEDLDHSILFANGLTALKSILTGDPDLKLVFPVQENSALHLLAEHYFDGMDQVTFIDPLILEDYYNLMGRAHLVLTDGGLVPIEASHLDQSVLVLGEELDRLDTAGLPRVATTGLTSTTIGLTIQRALSEPESVFPDQPGTSLMSVDSPSKRIRRVIKSALQQDIVDA